MNLTKDIIGTSIEEFDNENKERILESYEWRSYRDLTKPEDEENTVYLLVKKEVPYNAGPFRFAIGYIEDVLPSQKILHTVDWSICRWIQAIDEKEVVNTYP